MAKQQSASEVFGGILILAFVALCLYGVYRFVVDGAKKLVDLHEQHRADTPIFIEGDLQIGEKRTCVIVVRKSAPLERHLSCGYDEGFAWLSSGTPTAHTFSVLYHGDPKITELWQCQRNVSSFECWQKKSKGK